MNCPFTRLGVALKTGTVLPFTGHHSGPGPGFPGSGFGASLRSLLVRRPHRPTDADPWPHRTDAPSGRLALAARLVPREEKP